MIFLLIGLFVCHFLGDYVLSTSWMLAAKKIGKPVLPILAHGAVHTALMAALLILLKGVTPAVLIALVIQLVSHTYTDITKGRITASKAEVFGDISKPRFWWLFGVDQLAHQIIILIMAALVL
jgi:hypothetical protein